MAFYVDEAICIGCGNCEEVCPAAFHVKDEDGKAECYDPDACDFAGCCEAAEENCPVEAILNDAE